MQVGTDDPPGNYLGRPGVFRLGLYHDSAGSLDPDVGIGPREKAEVVFDNAEVFEYDSVWISGLPTVACLPTWSENTAEEQIVVGAASLDGPWVPWPEPIFKRWGGLCMAVRTTGAQQFLKLVPGTQLIDDFNPPKWPYASKGEWVPGYYAPADATRWSVTSSNGLLRVRTLAQTADASGRLPVRPPGPDVAVQDFWAAVDLVSFETAQEVGWLGIGARVSGDVTFPGANNGYIGGVAPHADGRNQARLNLFLGSEGTKGGPFTYKPGTPYRLIFSGVRERLSVELIDLDLGEAAVAPLVVTDWTFSQGSVWLWIQAGVGQTSCDVNLDNFFVTGTKP
jgi:hypothetical protein